MKNLTPALTSHLAGEDAMVLASIERKIARLYAEWAFYELRLSIAEIKAGFDPNQPRMSAGNEDGGRWVDATPHHHNYFKE